MSSGKRSDKQNLNRTVSAHEKLESLHASSSTTLGLQLKPLLTLNPQPTLSTEEIDAFKQSNGGGKTIAQRRLGKPRSDKQKVNRTVSAHPTLQSTPTKMVIQTSPRQQLKSSPTQQPQRLNAPLSATGRLPSHDFFSDTDASYLERELNRLGAKAGNQTGSQIASQDKKPVAFVCAVIPSFIV